MVPHGAVPGIVPVLPAGPASTGSSPTKHSFDTFESKFEPYRCLSAFISGKAIFSRTKRSIRPWREKHSSCTKERITRCKPAEGEAIIFVFSRAKENGASYRRGEEKKRKKENIMIIWKASVRCECFVLDIISPIIT